jgi:uncharacterized membrane protein YfcA
MELATLLPLIPVGLLVGVLIGCIGIGGVLLVPSLVYIGGMDVHIAIASCMFSYLFSGAIGAFEFARICQTPLDPLVHVRLAVRRCDAGRLSGSAQFTADPGYRP